MTQQSILVVRHTLQSSRCWAVPMLDAHAGCPSRKPYGVIVPFSITYSLTYIQHSCRPLFTYLRLFTVCKATRLTSSRNWWDRRGRSWGRTRFGKASRILFDSPKVRHKCSIFIKLLLNNKRQPFRLGSIKSCVVRITFPSERNDLSVKFLSKGKIPVWTPRIYTVN